MPAADLALPMPWVFLPGLLFVLPAAGLFAALGRWFDPVPAKVRVLLVAQAVALLGPSLFFGATHLPVNIQARQSPFVAYLDVPRGNVLQSDLMREVFPAAVQVRRAVAEGEWPLLAHYTGPGTALLADPQAMALQPTSWLAAVLPPLDALPLVMALRLLLAGTFTYLLLRRLGLATAAAAFGAAGYGLSGFVALWLGWPLANSAALLPVVLYAVARLADRGGRRDVALLGAALFTLLTGGHPETVLHVLLLGGAFAVDRALKLAGAARGRFLARGVAASLVALAVASPVLLPAADYLPQTMRARNVAGVAQAARAQPWLSGQWSTDRRRTPWPGWEARATAQVAPNAQGNHAFGEYWGPNNVNADATGFAGTLALAGALAALGWGLRRRPGERLMLGAAAVTLWITLRLPPTTRLLFSLPLLDSSISAHGRSRLVLAFALCFLAAASLDRWLHRETPTWRWGIAAGVAAALAAWGYLAHVPKDPGELALLRHLSLAAQLAAALLGLGLLAGAAWLARRRGDGAAPAWRRRGVAAVTAVAVAELLFFHLPAWPPLPRHAFPETPEIAHLRALQTTPDAHRIVALSNSFQPNQQAVYELPSPGVTGPVKPAALNDVLAPLLAQTWSGPDHFTAEDHPLYGLLGVRYLFIPHGHRPPRYYQRLFRGLGGRVFERPGALPPAWLPASARRCEGGWGACTAEVSDFAAEARVEPEAAPAGGWPAGGWRAAAAPVPEALEGWTWHGPSWRSARSRLAQPRLLATSMYQDDGWHLLADGEPLPAFLANGPFVAAWLPAGEQRLELVHRPPGFVLGLLLAALGLAVAPLALLAPRRPGVG